MTINLDNRRDWRAIVLPDLPADTRTDNAKRMQHAPYCHKCGAWSTKFTCDACQRDIRESMAREELRRRAFMRSHFWPDNEQICEKCRTMYAMRASLYCAGCRGDGDVRF